MMRSADMWVVVWSDTCRPIDGPSVFCAAGEAAKVAQKTRATDAYGVAVRCVVLWGEIASVYDGRRTE